MNIKVSKMLNEIINIMMQKYNEEYFNQKITLSQLCLHQDYCKMLIDDLIKKLTNVDFQLLKNVRAEIKMMNHVMEEIHDVYGDSREGFNELAHKFYKLNEKSLVLINQLIGKENEKE